VNLKKLNREDSIDFLNKGFKQVGVKIDEKHMGVEKLDGIIGWILWLVCF
jgi:hypothetical protein